MSATFIEINLSGDDVLSVFDQVGTFSQQPTAMLDEIGSYLDSDVAKRFYEGKAPDGSKWLVSQRAEAENGKTLVDTSILSKSVTHEVRAQNLVHGLTEKYAAIHQFGGKAGRGKRVTIPKREIIGIAPVQQSRIDKICLRWVDSWFQK